LKHIQPINEKHIVHSDLFRCPVALCLINGEKWFCLQDAEGEWHPKVVANSELGRAFGLLTLADLLQWEPED
jgi:hypothetical protein